MHARTFLTCLGAAAALGLAQTAAAQEGSAPDWANKAGAIGVGGQTTLGGSNGLHVRTYVTPQIGLALTLGARTGSETVESAGGDVTTSETAFAVALGGVYTLAAWSRGSFGPVLGLDLEHVAWSTEGPGADTSDSVLDVRIALGLQGEFFVTEHLSLFGQAGLVLDFLGDADGAPVPNPPGGYDLDGGIALDLGGTNAWGSAGFTVWFK